MELISHVSFSVSDFQKSLVFYDAVFEVLGYKRLFMNGTGAGWGLSVGREVFEIKKRVDQISKPSKGFHLAFHARDQVEVHNFYNEALKHGGLANGAPGPRPQYGENYYAAFVIDPDGYELEIKVF